MADRDVVVADEDFVDEEPHDLLALRDGEVRCVRCEAGAERFECLGELEVGRGVVQFDVERVDFGAERCLTRAELGRAGTQLLESDELFLVAIDQPPHGVLGAGEVTLQSLAAAAGGVGGAQRGQPPLYLGLDQGGVFEQREHLRPDELVGVGQADGAVAADTAFRATRAVGAGAAVVLAEDPVGASCRAAVVGIAALAADEDPLQ